ncbi:MAG TPA: DUF2007 domain-containing protein [Bryobacteraceae bacterium]|nr:DUF2007 domain-containing protein [Bryobacteraceae bacterium]
MAQDPENQEEPQDESSVDTSHELDMATLYSSQGVDAEMEADVIHGILESNGIPSFVVRATGVPVLGFEVQVPRARFEEAEQLIAEARAAGPEAAAEAEAASEEGR